MYSTASSSLSMSSTARRIGVQLLPSFLAPVLFPDAAAHAALTTAPLRSTAYLDGLRGLAAWSVFNAHLSALLDRSSGASFGHGGEHLELYKLPIVNLMYNGSFAVALFFIISGFALSIGPLAAMKKSPRNAEAAMQKLSSTILRRPFRLYLPSWASIFFIFILVRLDIFSYLIAHQDTFAEYIHGWPLAEEWPKHNPSFWAQLVDAVKTCTNMLIIFKEPTDADFGIPYNGVLWTIKLEFRSSLVLYLTHTIMFYMQRPMRIATATALIVLGCALWSFDFPLFWFGYILAELHTDRKQQPSSSSSSILATSASPSSSLLRSVSWWLPLLAGLWLGSFPGWEPWNSPDYAWLIRWTPFNFLPFDRFWSSVGGAIVMFCLPRIPVLVALCESKPVQYLGKVSFGFYLVHMSLVHILGTFFFYATYSITGQASILQSCMGFVIAYVLLLGSCIWAADLFWRFVDQPSVTIAARVEKFALQDR